jgi:hypothetical protein
MRDEFRTEICSAAAAGSNLLTAVVAVPSLGRSSGGRQFAGSSMRIDLALGLTVNTSETEGELVVDYKLELIVIPTTDMDRAKAFYSDGVGFRVDIDHRAGEAFRVIQLTPRGSACSIR